MTLETLEHQFKEKVPVFKRLEEEVIFILKSTLVDKGIKVHSITSRVKTFDSFRDKVHRKQSKKPFEEIQDIVGLRVVCLFLSDIAHIGDAIRDTFRVLSEDNKIEGYDAASFGYLSVHFVAEIKKEYSGPRYNQLVGIPFEIQVRTIAMHAWATISHYLDYKSEIDVPKELRRDFYALSGLFYVADTHFEMFFKSRQTLQVEMARFFEKAKSKLDQEINMDSLTAYLHKKFPDREHSGPQEVSKLIHELANAGYTSIGDIERAVERAWDAFLLMEEEYPPYQSVKFADIGVIRLLFGIIDDNFSGPMPGDMEIHRERYKKLLKK